MSLSDFVLPHLKQRQRLAERTASRVLRRWQTFDLRDLDGSWLRNRDALVADVTTAQIAAARTADTYLRQIDSSPAPRVAAEAFAGVTLDGREVAPQMYSAVTTTKRAIGAGMPAREAFTVGASFLATVVGTMVSDMGRQADLTAGVARRRTRYIRVVQPGACSRCAVLAGAASSQTAYLRHPRCQCTAFPIATREGVEDWTGFEDTGLYASPQDYFESLSPAEQARTFTRAGAEAIRQGADPIKVVNARRGAYGIGYSGHYNPPSVRRGRLTPVTIGTRPDGSPLQVYATTEGTTRRGSYGRRSSSVRLMPEQIAPMAGGDTDRWIELLAKYGYLY